MIFHGYSGNALNTIKTTNFNQLADKNGFIACYPQGLIDKDNNAFWQVGYTFHKDLNVDDVKFIQKLIEKLQSEFQLSKKNVFMTGFSNGGDFCNLLSCETDGLFRATAPIISCFMQEIFNNCQYANPMPTLMLNGTKDSITFWDGDMSDSQGYGPYISTKSMINFRLKQIQHDKVIRDTLFSPDSNEKTIVAIDKYSSSISENQVWMYSYLNGGHGYPNYLNLEEQIFSFFNIYLDK
jgi:polyhydroxybutyrate depolymerase